MTTEPEAEAVKSECALMAFAILDAVYFAEKVLILNSWPDAPDALAVNVMALSEFFWTVIVVSVVILL